MKCAACNYEFDFEFDFEYNIHNGINILKGDEKFIEISGHFYKHENFEDKRIDFVACPKCKTIKIDN